jgi:hypothetical protein
MREDDYSPGERQAFASLPRESAPDRRDEERIVARLRAEGFFRRRWTQVLRLAAAALVIMACGIAIGAALARAGSLESELAREDLTAPEAAALLERARGAYGTARDRYFAATGSEAPASDPSSADPSGKQPPVRTAGVLWF